MIKGGDVKTRRVLFEGKGLSIYAVEVSSAS